MVAGDVHILESVVMVVVEARKKSFVWRRIPITLAGTKVSAGVNGS